MKKYATPLIKEKKTKQKQKLRVGEMAQQSRALAVLLEDLASNPTWLKTLYTSNPKESNDFFCRLWALHTDGTPINMKAKHTCI